MIFKKSAWAAALAVASGSALAQAGATGAPIAAPSASKPAASSAQVIQLKRVSPAAKPTLSAPVATAAGAAAQAAAPGADVATPPAVQGLLGKQLPGPAPRVQAQELPGLGVMPGAPVDNRIKSVRVGTDRNELIYISRHQLNKISTPFDDPKAVDATGATLKAVGQEIFVKPNSDEPLTIYVTNGGKGQSIGLTLVPAASLPAQAIVLEPDTRSKALAGETAAPEPVASDYVSRINQIVRSLALGGTPDGFTRSRLPASVVSGADVVIEPQYKYAGSVWDLYAYKLRSKSAAPLELSEEAFYSEGVRAVAFYPSHLLQDQEETTVFVISDRAESGAKK